MQKLKNILIMVSVPPGEVGGSQISAYQIAKSFATTGYKVYFNADKDLPFIGKDENIVVIPDGYQFNKLTGYLTRGRKLYSLIKKLHINLIVALDKVSCYHASIPAALSKIPLVPIIPGGAEEDIKYPPLRTNKIIVFSEENKSVLINKWNFEAQNIIVKSGRFTFEPNLIENYSVNSEFNIAFITRLSLTKFQAFTIFLDQLRGVSSKIKINVHVVGNGHDEEEFKKATAAQEFSNVIFIGYKDINFKFLQNYHLVVSQGRGIIEAMSLSIPGAVCGTSGYKGLVTFSNFDQLRKTNFTGREAMFSGNLDDDIKLLTTKGNEYVFQVAKLIRDEYDVTHLKDNIIDLTEKYQMIPGNGRFYGAVMQNVNMFLKRKR